jgi:hypothetical protein
MTHAFVTENPSTGGAQTDATALDAVATGNRRFLMIQNVGTNPLFVKLGAGCSTGDYTVVLKGGSGAADGIGGSFIMDAGAVWQSEVTIAGTTPSYVATELV